MPSLEVTALEHPEHSIAERPAAQAVDERVVGIGRPVLEDRGLPEVLQKLREHRGVALRRAPRPFFLLNKSNISLPFTRISRCRFGAFWKILYRIAYLSSHAPVDAGVEGAHVAHMVGASQLKIYYMIDIVTSRHRVFPVFLLESIGCRPIPLPHGRLHCVRSRQIPSLPRRLGHLDLVPDVLPLQHKIDSPVETLASPNRARRVAPDDVPGNLRRDLDSLNVIS